MRLRYVPGQYQYLKNCEKVITEPEKQGFKLNKVFNNNNPIHVELGCGKGKFLRENAIKNPHINYFGFEKSVKVAYRLSLIHIWSYFSICKYTSGRNEENG